jgi:hypothetical protein
VKERLTITLSVTVGGTAHTISGGNVRALSLDLTSYGVDGSVTFVLQDDQAYGGSYSDDFLADFVKSDLGEVSLTVQPTHWSTSSATSVAGITTSGIILDKRVTEHAHVRGFSASPVLHRTYTVRFCDPGRALWRQHFPVELFTSKTFKDVMESYKGSKISFTYDWDAVSTSRSIIFFHLDPVRGASFYDLVLWFVRHYGGVFTFDHAAGTYSLTSVKDTSGTAATLLRDELTELSSVFPPVARWTRRVLNTYAESIATETVTNEYAATGIYRDTLLRTQIAQDVTDRVALETARPLVPGRELELSFASFPTVAVSPGSLLDVSSTGGFSAELISATEPFRVWRLSLDARALDSGSERDYSDSEGSFELSIVARLEQKSETTVRLPHFVEPHWPGYLEGKVLSEVGEDTDTTYQVYTDETTSLDQYRITIPLFSSQIVAVPFEPHQGSGTFYVPAYKNARVLVAFGFDSAWLARLLDWRSSAKVSSDGQGEQLFFGKSDTSSTSVLHDYEDNKPVLQIKRTNDKDVAILRIEEGKLTLQVKEES